tara:strand:- start:1010 stop:1363 length:354 start_codon:yes stop_codon:yes gene_type:complete
LENNEKTITTYLSKMKKITLTFLLLFSVNGYCLSIGGYTFSGYEKFMKCNNVSKPKEIRFFKLKKVGLIQNTRFTRENRESGKSFFGINIPFLKLKKLIKMVDIKGMKYQTVHLQIR